MGKGKKDLTKKNKKEVTETNNVFTGMPKKGTVLATVNAEELAAYHTLSEDVLALEANPKAFDKQETYDITREHKKWWMDTCKVYGIKYAWPITIDYASGELFISR